MVLFVPLNALDGQPVEVDNPPFIPGKGPVQLFDPGSTVLNAPVDTSASAVTGGAGGPVSVPADNGPIFTFGGTDPAAPVTLNVAPGPANGVAGPAVAALDPQFFAFTPPNWTYAGSSEVFETYGQNADVVEPPAFHFAEAQNWAPPAYDSGAWSADPVYVGYDLLLI